MAFVDDAQRSQLLSKAIEAIDTSDASRSSELYRDIVQTLTRLCNKNQKEIASELQQLAKAIEEQGRSGEAFEFKQRTCAVMLEISMEDRRRTKVDGLNMEQAATTPVNASAQAAKAAGESAAQNFDPGSTDYFVERTPSRLPGVDTCEIEPITDVGPNSEFSLKNDLMLVQGPAIAIDTALPFLCVEYLYLGSKDYERDLAYYREVLGAQEVWKFDRFGSRITAFSLSAGPLILLADHRQAPSCQPVFRVSDLASCARDLTARGWKPVAGPFGTPNGEAYSFEDPSGNRFAIFQVDETSTDRAYFDPTEGE